MRKEQQSQVSAHPEDFKAAVQNVTAAVEKARARGFEMGRRQPVTNSEWVDRQGNPVDRALALDTLSA